jgi:hypothetical protein
MAKFTIAVQFVEDNGSTPIGPNIAFSNQTSHSAAKAAIDAEIQTRVTAATVAQQKLLDIQALFNS